MRKSKRHNYSYPDPYENIVKLEKLDPYEALIKFNNINKQNNKSIETTDLLFSIKTLKLIFLFINKKSLLLI